jgi:hypothetical protein
VPVSALLFFGPRLWAGAAILGLAWFWPLGLGLLILFLWSRRMGCWHFAHEFAGRDRDRHGDRDERRHERRWGRHRHEIAERWWAAMNAARPSGNVAFDEYRSETLRRLEEDQKEFQSFLDRLRHAKDKSEFDQFMAERVRRPEAPRDPSPDQPA